MNSVRGLPCNHKAFYSPETQHGRCVIRVYHLRNSDLVINGKSTVFFDKLSAPAKFRNTGKLISFVFEGATMQLKMGN